MKDSPDVIVWSGKAAVKSLTDTAYHWPDLPRGEDELVFSRAYEIGSTDWDEGIYGCEYEVRGREFRDRSFQKGETLRKLARHCELRRHEDGTEFLFYFAPIPTFDTGDREWASDRCAVVYADARGVNLIGCTYGYKIARITVYIGLTNAAPALTELLEIVKSAAPAPQEKEAPTSLLSRIVGLVTGKKQGLKQTP